VERTEAAGTVAGGAAAGEGRAPSPAGLRESRKAAPPGRSLAPPPPSRPRRSFGGSEHAAYFPLASMSVHERTSLNLREYQFSSGR
jgi:hypothetical protein